MTYRGRDSRDHLATFPTLAFIKVGVAVNRLQATERVASFPPPYFA